MNTLMRTARRCTGPRVTRLRGHCVKATWLALSVRTLQALDQKQKPESARSEARGRRRLGPLILIANTLMQIGLVVCTGLGFLLTSLKLPHYGVIANLIGQVFWVYSSYRAWREADQIGIFLSTIIITLILIYGVTNYWFFGETFSH